MTSPLVVVEQHTDGVVELRLDRPPVNPISRALAAELTELASDVSTRDDVGAVVVTGGPKIFAAGADVHELTDKQGGRDVNRALRSAFDAVAALPCPVIAAVNGLALGGGLELALACDLRVAANDARLGQPEVALGILPGAGGTQRLPRLVGAARAKDLIWTGRPIGAEEALAIGLVDRVVAPDRVMDEAVAWARDLARGPRRAIALAKIAVDRGLDTTLPEGLDVERDHFVAAFGTEDAAIGIRSFLEHGPGRARFVGR
jgi:enoyl-CoA hydratase/carnithine racemase